jgi:hypothetical protein
LLFHFGKGGSRFKDEVPARQLLRRKSEFAVGLGVPLPTGRSSVSPTITQDLGAASCRLHFGIGVLPSLFVARAVLL